MDVPAPRSGNSPVVLGSRQSGGRLPTPLPLTERSPLESGPRESASPQDDVTSVPRTASTEKLHKPSDLIEGVEASYSSFKGDRESPQCEFQDSGVPYVDTVGLVTGRVQFDSHCPSSASKLESPQLDNTQNELATKDMIFAEPERYLHVDLEHGGNEETAILGPDSGDVAFTAVSELPGSARDDGEGQVWRPLCRSSVLTTVTPAEEREYLLGGNTAIFEGLRNISQATNYSLRLKEAKPKVGSLENIHHKPGGGTVTIEDHKLDWSQEPKVGSLDNLEHVPKKSNVHIVNNLPKWKTESRVASFENWEHHPLPSEVKVLDQNLEWNAQPRVGSLDNLEYTPQGGLVKIPKKSVKWKSEAKVGSLENIRKLRELDTESRISELSATSDLDETEMIGSHQSSYRKKYPLPEVKVAKYKMNWTTRSKGNSFENMRHRSPEGFVGIPNEKLNWKKKSKIGSLENIGHRPHGGHVTIEDQSLNWNGAPKVGSLANASHKPGGGNVVLPTKKLKWNKKSKVDSLRSMFTLPDGDSVIKQRLDINWKALPEHLIPRSSVDDSTGGIKDAHVFSASPIATSDASQQGHTQRRAKDANPVDHWLLEHRKTRKSHRGMLKALDTEIEALETRGQNTTPSRNRGRPAQLNRGVSVLRTDHYKTADRKHRKVKKLDEVFDVNRTTSRGSCPHIHPQLGTNLGVPGRPVGQGVKPQTPVASPHGRPLGKGNLVGDKGLMVETSTNTRLDSSRDKAAQHTTSGPKPVDRRNPPTKGKLRGAPLDPIQRHGAGTTRPKQFKVRSLGNTDILPGINDNLRVPTEELTAKVGSLENINHSPGEGGHSSVFSEKLWITEPKVVNSGSGPRIIREATYDVLTRTAHK